MFNFSPNTAPQPSIYPLGIRIDEPIATLTDVMVAVVCFYAFIRLQKNYKVDHRIYLLTRGYFLAMGIATFIGGVIGHGFIYALDRSWKFPGWAVSMIAINMIERVMINYTKPFMNHKVATFFSWFNIVELLTFATLAFTTLNFQFVEIHSGYGLTVFVLGFSIYNYIKRDKNRDILYFIWAVVAAACASFFFTSRIGLDKWYNYIDISHTFMTISALLFYLGARKMLQHIEERAKKTNGEASQAELVADHPST